MPGIITHSKIFFEALKHVRKKKDYTSCNRSIEILFSNAEFLRAAFFGSLGPDVFNYLPFIKERGFFGTPISAFLHSDGIEPAISSLMEQVLMVDDHNNEWAATRRAYLYGYAAHLVTDAVFHPFIFYWTGFPDTREKKNVDYYREQYLLFSYNMDIFFQYFHEPQPFDLVLEEMFPVKKYRRRPQMLHPAIKDLLLETLRDVFPSSGQGTVIRRELDRRHKAAGFGMMDFLPHTIPRVFGYKRSSNYRLKAIQDKLRRKRIISPDYVTRYPDPKRLNRHVLNLHRERWFYPAGSAGLHYESVEDLFKIALGRVINVWKKLEATLYVSPVDLSSLHNELRIDAFTGEPGKNRYSMHVKNPHRLRF